MKTLLLILALLSAGCSSTKNFSLALHYGNDSSRITIDTTPVFVQSAP